MGARELLVDLIPLDITHTCLIFAIKVQKFLRKHYQGYLTYLRDTSKDEEKISDLSVVCEYLEIRMSY